MSSMERKSSSASLGEILDSAWLESFGKWIARLVRRELPMALVSWDVVQQFSPPAGDRPAAEDAVHLRISGSRIAKLHPADIADIVEELGAKERSAVFNSLTEEIAADTLEQMELDDQVSVIEHMDDDRASEILQEMPPDEVADILAELPDERAQVLLRLMEREEAADVRELLAYGEDTAGGLMTTELVTVAETFTAEQCIDELRRLEPDAESIYYVFVVDAEEHLRGVLSLRDLIVAPPQTPISDIMIRDVVTVRPADSKGEVAAVLTKYNLMGVPVVDDDFRLQGLVTVDDALDAVLPDSIKRKLPRVP